MSLLQCTISFYMELAVLVVVQQGRGLLLYKNVKPE